MGHSVYNELCDTGLAMDSSRDDKAIMEFYDRRRVTRSQFKEFLDNPQDTRPFCDLLRDISEHQREALFKTGESVCRIDVDGNPEGTGFHLGGGWILTNQHVICCRDEERSNASSASFTFPSRTIPPAARDVVFSYFQDPEGTTAVHDSRKDLALIHVKEISPLIDEDDVPVQNRVHIPGLVCPFQKPPKEGDRVFLVHYGDGVEDKRNPPQQFSVSDNEVCFSVENEHGNRFSVHTAHSRHGSSGAPLLVFNEEQNKFLVAAVHYAGPESAEIIDSPGFALWYAKKHEWLQDTVPVASLIVKIRQYSNPELWAISQPGIKATLHENFREMCDDLQQYLYLHSLRITVTVKLPEGTDFNSETINFAK